LLDRLIEFVAKIDAAISTSKCVKQMNLTRPMIVENNAYEVIALRHPIIEANDESGIYVPNDLYLGVNSDTQHNHMVNHL